MQREVTARRLPGEILCSDDGTGRRRRTLGLVLLCLIAIALPARQDAVAQEAAAQEAAIGQVVQQQGAVTALRATVARSLHLGAPVFRGDRIITAAAAKVEIAFEDGSTLSLGADTTVEVEDYAPADRRRGTLRLLIGIIRTSLSSLWSGGFEVRTRAAVASVRSTDWITEAREHRASVFVVSGAVAVTGTAGGDPVLLAAGDGTDVEVGGAPSAPTQWGDARVQDVLARTRLP